MDESRQSLAFITHSPQSYRTKTPRIDDSQLARRKRRRTSPSELAILEDEFRKNNKPCKSIREEIAIRVGMEEKAVQIWFQNKRQQWRRTKAESLKRTLSDSFMVPRHSSDDSSDGVFQFYSDSDQPPHSSQPHSQPHSQSQPQPLHGLTPARRSATAPMSTPARMGSVGSIGSIGSVGSIGMTPRPLDALSTNTLNQLPVRVPTPTLTPSSSQESTFKAAPQLPQLPPLGPQHMRVNDENIPPPLNMSMLPQPGIMPPVAAGPSPPPSLAAKRSKSVRLAMSAEGKAEVVVRSPLRALRANTMVGPSIGSSGRAERFVSLPAPNELQQREECAKNLLFLRSGK